MNKEDLEFIIYFGLSFVPMILIILFYEFNTFPELTEFIDCNFMSRNATGNTCIEH